MNGQKWQTDTSDSQKHTVDIGLTLNHVSDRKAYGACSSNCHIKSGLLKVTGRYIHCKVVTSRKMVQNTDILTTDH